MGPVAIVWVPADLSIDKVNSISLKSFNLMSSENGLIPKSLGVIPFPSVNLKGLIKSLAIKDTSRRGGAIDSAITILFSEANDLIFYRYINTFEDLCNKAASEIIDLVESKASKEKIQDELKTFYNTLSETIVKCIMKKSEPVEAEKSLLLLFNLIPKNLDKVINAVLLREPVVVSGDKGLTKMIIDTLTLFSIKRTPEIIYWTKEYMPGDILGVPLSHIDNFKKGVAVDLRNKKVLRGNSSNFCKNLMNKARLLEPSQAEQYIKDLLQKIHSVIDKIHEIIVKNMIPSLETEEFLRELDLDELEFIEAYMVSTYPKLLKEIPKAISLCRKNVSKILGAFGKEKW